MSIQSHSFLSDHLKACEQQVIPPKTLLLGECEIARNIYFVEEGVLRLYFYHHGKDITFQFFFEESAVTSFDSLHSGLPSQFYLESLETTTVRVMTKDHFFGLINELPEGRQKYEEILVQRFHHYQSLFLSRIKNTPQERYEELLRDHPQILQRIPQHYIASFLGITPVSLSRIRSRLS